MVADVTNVFEKHLSKQKFELGEKVKIDFTRKCYDGKSVRRRVMDKLISKCQELPLTNLADMLGHERYMIPDCTEEYVKIVNDMQNGKRHSLPKIYEEKRRWIKGISKILDNFEYAIILGKEMRGGQMSNICPSNISYCKEMSLFTKYTVLIVGKMPPSNVCEPSSNIFGGGSDGKMNVCTFTTTEIFDNDLIKIEDND